MIQTTNTTVRVNDYETKAVSDEVAYAAVKSGEWDIETFREWASERASDAFTQGCASQD